MFLQDAVELGYNVMKGAEYFVSLGMSVILTKQYNIVVNSVEVIDTTEHLMIQTRCQLN